MYIYINYYRYVLKIENDLYDVTENGQSVWVSVMDMYERRLEKIDLRIIKLLGECAVRNIYV